jgi:hypothetical protein
MRSPNPETLVLCDGSATIAASTMMPNADAARMFTLRDISLTGGLFRVGGGVAPAPSHGAADETVRLSDGTHITFEAVMTRKNTRSAANFPV